MFKTPLCLEADAAPDYWVVTSALVWEDSVFGRLVVPVGFRTDLASIPRTLRNLPFLDPDGLSRRPATLHDWLYDTAGGRRYGKKFADDFLYASLQVEGAGRPTAWAFWAAVHVFGGGPWADAARDVQTR